VTNPNSSSYSSALTIEELDSNRNVLRTLTLMGPGMPKMGAEWAFENALVTTWYPGNSDEATQQVLVAKEIPSNWEGEWNLTRLNRRPQSFSDSSGQGQIVSPGALIDLVEDIGRKGLRLRVSWLTDSSDANVARKVVREGRFKRFSAKYRTSIDVDWTMSFDWQSRGIQQARISNLGDPNIDNASANLTNSLYATQAALAALIAAQNNPTAFTLGQLEQIADYPLKLVGVLDGAIENGIFKFAQVSGIVTQFKNLPYNFASQAVGTAGDMIAACNEFTDAISQQPVEKQVLDDQIANMTRARSDIGAAEDATMLAARAAQLAQSQLRDVKSTNPGGGMQSPVSSSGGRQGTVYGVRLTKSTDTPQSLSQLYYGTVDHDIDILRANNLPWHQVTFEAGSIIIIPVITTNTGP
jgi:hypothetical protein